MVSFNVTFLYKKYDKEYKGFDVNYIWEYVVKVPKKYQRIAVRCIVDLAKAAGTGTTDTSTKTNNAKEVTYELVE